MPQRVFTQDIRRADGSVKFPNGFLSSDYGPTTWDQLAHDVGKPLDDFSRPLDDAAGAALAAESAGGGPGQPEPTAPASAGPAPGPVREQPRRKTKARKTARMTTRRKTPKGAARKKRK